MNSYVKKSPVKSSSPSVWVQQIWVTFGWSGACHSSALAIIMWVLFRRSRAWFRFWRLRGIFLRDEQQSWNLNTVLNQSQTLNHHHLLLLLFLAVSLHPVLSSGVRMVWETERSAFVCCVLWWCVYSTVRCPALFLFNSCVFYYTLLNSSNVVYHQVFTLHSSFCPRLCPRLSDC